MPNRHTIEEFDRLEVLRQDDETNPILRKPAQMKPLALFAKQTQFPPRTPSPRRPPIPALQPSAPGPIRPHIGDITKQTQFPAPGPRLPFRARAAASQKRTFCPR